MFDSIALNVVISLVFIYLLYSLLVTTLNEGIASFFNLRAKTLEKGIRRMLTDHGDQVNGIVDDFYKQPLIKYLAEDNTKKPSYLNSASFANALVHLCHDLATDLPEAPSKLWAGIQKIKETNPQTGKYLETLYNDASGDVKKFQELAENWFNDTMERATGWYKKQTQKITLAVAFVVALAFNVDTIGIVKNLSANPKLATQMVEMADQYTKLNQRGGDPKDTATAKSIKECLDKAKALTTHQSDIQKGNAILGLGWSWSWSIPKDTIRCCVNDKKCADRTPYKLAVKSTGNKIRYVVETLLSSLLGLLITALAISLGAPFWFDLLNKFMQLRGSKPTDDKKTPTSVTINT